MKNKIFRISIFFLSLVWFLGLVPRACRAEPTFFDDFGNTNFIDVQTVFDANITGSQVIPSGVSFGALEADPTMEALFHFEGDPNFWEDDIRLTYDFAHQRHNGFWSDSSGLLPTNGKFGSAYFFTSNGQRKWMNIIDEGINKDNVTVSFWTKLSQDLVPADRVDFRFLESSDNYMIALTGGNNLQYRVGNSNQRIDVNGLDWKAETWHHVVAILKSGNHQLWIDGQLAGTNNYSGGTTFGSGFSIGWPVYVETANYANIAMDEAAIWNRVLNPEEIQALSEGRQIRTGSFESTWIDMGASFNALKVSLAGSDVETMTVYITSDGINWSEVTPNVWVRDTHCMQLPCSSFKYKVSFSGGSSNVSLDSIRFEWKNIEEKADAPFTFVVYGDSRTNELTHQRVIRQIEAIDPAFVLQMGDIVTGVSEGLVYEWRSALRTIDKLMTRRTAGGLMASYYATPGNHDKPDPFHGYFDAFNYPPHYTVDPVDPDNPYPDPDDPNHYYNKYYAFKYRNTLFISLNVYEGDRREIYHGTYPNGDTQTHEPIDPTDLSGASAQYIWLYNILQYTQYDPSIKWKFVFFHSPAFSSGPHGSALDASGAHAYLWLRQHLCPLFEHFKVNIVFCGHDHDYERTQPISISYDPSKECVFSNWPTDANQAKNYISLDGVIDLRDGVTYIVTGGGGAGLAAVGNSTWTAYSESVYHATKITIDGDRLYGESVRIDGTRFDPFSLNLMPIGFLFGDVSGDSVISVYDAALAAQFAAGIITLTQEQFQKADVSGDGKVTKLDAALIAQYAAGLISKFTAEGP